MWLPSRRLLLSGSAASLLWSSKIALAGGRRGSPLNDGFSGAPATAAQHPTILSGYTKRPPWRVAGVDYGVGIPDGQSFTGHDASVQGNWDTVFGAGHATVSLGPPAVVTIDSTITLIDGWDFATGTNGPINLSISGRATSLTIQNSQFGTASGNSPPGSYLIVGNTPQTTVTVQKCKFDGSGNILGTGGSIGIININNGTSVIFQYNWVKNMPAIGVSHSVNADFFTTAMTYKFNLFENMAMVSGEHMNILQNESGNFLSIVYNNDVEFNTFYQEPQIGSGTTFQFYSDQKNGIMNAPICAYNTIIAKGANSLAVNRTNGMSVNRSTVLNAPGGWQNATTGSMYPYYYVGSQGNGTTTAASAVPPTYGTPVLGYSSGTAGVIRVQVADATLFTTGLSVAIFNNAVYTQNFGNITHIDGTHFDLTGTTFFSSSATGKVGVSFNAASSPENAEYQITDGTAPVFAEQAPLNIGGQAPTMNYGVQGEFQTGFPLFNTFLQGNAWIHDNYFDMTGAGLAGEAQNFYTPVTYQGKAETTFINWLAANNIDMNTGSVVAPQN